MSEELEGWGESLNINQVRMDLNGNLGVVIAESSDAICLQRSARTVEFIPIEDKQIFSETTFSLGEL